MFDEFLDAPIWGARRIAEVLNLRTPDGEPDERAAFYGLEKGYYDATKVGRLWSSTRRRLLAPHLKGTATADSAAEAV
jgi:hypothetical protein